MMRPRAALFVHCARWRVALLGSLLACGGAPPPTAAAPATDATDPARRREPDAIPKVAGPAPSPSAAPGVAAPSSASIDDTVRAALRPRPLVEIDVPPGPLPYWESTSCRPSGCVPVAPPAYPADTETIATGLRNQFLRCFEGNPDTIGTRPSGIAVSVRVGPNGEVMTTRAVAAYGAPSAAVRDCVSIALKRVSFGPPGGGQADVKLTVHFRPQP